MIRHYVIHHYVMHQTIRSNNRRSAIDPYKLSTTLVHIAESEGNCGLVYETVACMERLHKCYTLPTCYIFMLRCNFSATHKIKHICKLAYLPLSCIGYNFYGLDEVSRSNSKRQASLHSHEFNFQLT